MTKDDDFKRLVRRRAGETGERYTAVRSQLEAERRQHDGHWLVVRTFPGAEEEVQQWVGQQGELGVNEVLIPRFQGRKFAPGVVLLQLSPNPDLTALQQQPWFVSFVGAKTPQKVDWDGVRSILSEHASVRLRPAPTTAPLRTPRHEESGGSSDDALAFEAIASAAKAARALASEGARRSPEDRRTLLDQGNRGIRARRQLWETYRHLVDDVVAKWEPVAPADVAPADLLEAGLDGLAEAIEHFCGSKPFRRLLLPEPGPGAATKGRFASYAAWWIRHSISEYLVSRESG